MRIIKLKELYKAIAIILLNTLVLIVILNVLLGIAFYFKDYIAGKNSTKQINKEKKIKLDKLFNSDGAPLDNGRRSDYQLTWFDYSAYEQIVGERYAGAVLDDFFYLSKLGFIYQPWVQFSEPIFNGKLVNIDLDPKGFPVRRTINPENNGSSSIKIFTFGGSTTFGYNVSDEHTWPSQLSIILNKRARSAKLNTQVEVINYGRGYYDTSQELVLLIDLLKVGHRPSLVIFMDGVNLGPDMDVPYFTEKLSRKFHDLQFNSNRRLSFLKNFDWVPLIRLTISLKHRILGKSPVLKKRLDSKVGLQQEEDFIKHVVNRFLTNRKMAGQISELYRTKALFFLQPDATYNYPENLYRVSLTDEYFKSKFRRQKFYGLIKNTKGFVDLTELFVLWGSKRKAIIDDCHYSPSFNHFLAQHVAKYIDLASLATKPIDLDGSNSTGAPRRLELNNLISE